MSTARAYARRCAIDALLEGYEACGVQTEEAEELATKAVDAVIAYAEQLALVGEVSALRARSENLRAALASIEARIDNVFALGTVPHPLREALGILRAAARGALEVDDKR